VTGTWHQAAPPVTKVAQQLDTAVRTRDWRCDEEWPSAVTRLSGGFETFLQFVISTGVLREFSRVVLRCNGAGFREPLGNINARVQQDVAPWIEGTGSHDEFGLVTEF
jgi:hypothetical protein